MREDNTIQGKPAAKSLVLNSALWRLHNSLLPLWQSDNQVKCIKWNKD